MSADIKRLSLTNAIITALQSIVLPQAGGNLLVGNQIIPKGSGWVGEPNAPGSRFLPYIVVTTLTATQAEGPLGDSQADWVIPYAIQCFGVLPEQAQWVADQSRAVLKAMRNDILDLGDAHYKIDRVSTDTLGGINRIQVSNTPFYGIQDGVSLSLRKRRS